MSHGTLQKTLNTCGPLLISNNTWFWPLPLLVAPARPLHVTLREQLRGPQGGTRAPFEKP